jgi:hypothetical protein
MTPLEKNLQKLSRQKDADVFLFNSPIHANAADSLRNMICKKTDKRKNVVIFISTFGGDADSAYRIMSCLHNHYSNVAAYVFGYCKSAGTLAVIGANEIVFGSFGELGPLDVQLAKPDELVVNTSGLDIFQALAVVTNSAFETFERYFLQIVNNSQGSISSKTSAEIARSLVVGLFGPMTEQIDTERLGEVQRAINIANSYGIKLNKGNLKLGQLEKLVQGYPTHSFVIDFDEAKTIFKVVRRPDELEKSIENDLSSARRPAKEPMILDLLTMVSPSLGNRVKNAQRKKTSKRQQLSPPTSK